MVYDKKKKVDLDKYEAYSNSFKRAMVTLDTKIKKWVDAEKTGDKKELAKSVVELEKAIVVGDDLYEKLDNTLDDIGDDKKNLEAFVEKYGNSIKGDGIDEKADKIFIKRDGPSYNKYMKLIKSVVDSKSNYKPRSVKGFSEVVNVLSKQPKDSEKIGFYIG